MAWNSKKPNILAFCFCFLLFNSIPLSGEEESSKEPNEKNSPKKTSKETLSSSFFDLDSIFFDAPFDDDQLNILNEDILVPERLEKPKPSPSGNPTQDSTKMPTPPIAIPDPVLIPTPVPEPISIPVPVLVPMPVPEEISVPIPTPVLIPTPVPEPISIPVPVLVPMPTPEEIAIPIPTPVLIPTPVPEPISIPVPVLVPTPAPEQIPVIIPTPVLIPTPVPEPISIPIPVLVPTPTPEPIPIPFPIFVPTPDLSANSEQPLLTVPVAEIRTNNLSGSILSIANQLNEFGSNIITQSIATLPESQAKEALISLSPDQYNLINYMLNQLVFIDCIETIRSRGAMQRATRALNQPILPEPIHLPPSSQKTPEPKEEENPISSHKLVTAAKYPYGSTKKFSKEEAQNYVFWGNIFGDIQKQTQTCSFSGESFGALLGFEVYGLEGGWLGTNGGYGRSYFGRSENFGNSSANSYFLGLYGAGTPGVFFLEFALFGAFNQIESEQKFSAADVAITTNGSFQSATLAPHFSLGFDVAWDWAVLEPYISLDFAQNWIFDFKEKTTELFRRFDFSNSSILRSELGFHAYQEKQNETSLYAFQETLGFVNKTFFNMGRAKINFDFLPNAPSLTINDFKSPQNLFTFGLQFLFKKKSGFFSSINYQGEYGSKVLLNDLHLELGCYF